MDKKNTIIGVLLLVGAIASFVLSQKFAPPPAPTRPAVTATSSGSPLAQNEAPASGPARSVTDAAFTAPEKSSAPAEYLTLENEFVNLNPAWDPRGALAPGAAKKKDPNRGIKRKIPKRPAAFLRT